MSTTDERIVSLKFENSGFEAGASKAIGILEKLEKALKFDGASSGIDSVQKSVNSFNMDEVSSSVEECSSHFSAFEAFVAGIFMNLGSRVTNFGLDMAKNLTVKPLMDGFSEYELQMRSVQTILSNSGEKLKEAGYTTQEEQIGIINDRLDQLNKYADKTIYNFSEMTRNIGTFTAAGVDLDTAVVSIQGIANLAAASGSSSQQASTAMYQLSQAIAAGSVKLQDWNSVVNAGMGGEIFQEALKRTARNHGIAVDSMIEKAGSFRESLTEGWITADVLTDTLSQLTMSYGEVGDEAYNTNLEILKNQGYSQEDAEAILDLAKNAEEAATKVRTWTQLWDTVGEALGSGWATTWRTIVGDFLEATDLFTHLSEGITGIISSSADARNAVLADWAAAGGRTALVDGIKYAFDAITSVVETIGQAFSDVFGISAEELFNLSAAFATFAEGLVPTQEVVQFLYDAFYNVFTVIHSIMGVIGNFIRIIVHVAGFVWRLVEPFAKLAAVVGGEVLEGIARVSSFIHMLSDYLEEFVSIITTGLGDIGPSVQTFVDNCEPIKSVAGYFDSLKNTVAGKVAGGFLKLVKATSGSKKEFKAYVNELGNLTPFEQLSKHVETLRTRFTDFADGFSKAEDKLAYLKTSLGPIVDDVKAKFEGLRDIFSSPKGLRRAISDFIGKADMSGGLGDIIKNLFGYNADSYKLFKSIWEPLSDLQSKLYSFFGEVKTWGDVLDVLKQKFSEAFPTIGGIVSSVSGYFDELFNTGKTFPQIVLKIFLDVYDKLKYGVTHIPEILTNFLTNLTNIGSEIWTATEGLRTSFVDGIRSIFENLPSPAEIGTALAGFVTSIKDFISEQLASIGKDDKGGKGKKGKKGEDSFGINSIISGIFGAFSGIGDTLSAFSLALPENFFSDIFSGFIDWFVDGFTGMIDAIPVDKITEGLDKLIEKIAAIIKKQPWMLAVAGFADLLHSFSTMNKGIGKFGKTFGKSIRKAADSIGKGLSNFGEGFTKFKKQTKAEAFLKIAIGLAALAGALWILAQIPSDRLVEVGAALAIMAVGVAGVMLLVGWIQKLTEIDLGDVGKAFAGFGIGILALAGALWVFSKLPAENLDENIDRILKMVIVISVMLAAIGAAGQGLKGAAATLLAMAVSITLLLIPIALLGLMPEEILVKGGNAVGLIMLALTGAIAIMEVANKNAASIAGAALALIALAVSITLLTVPIFLLGAMPLPILVKGGAAVGLLAVVLALAVGLIGLMARHALGLAAGAIAAIALAAAITLLVIPIKLLAGMGPEIVQGGVAAGLIGVVLVALVGVLAMVGTLGAGILLAIPALIAITIAIGLMAVVVAGLAFLESWNADAVSKALYDFVGIALALGAVLAILGTFGTAAGVGILAIAAGIGALGLALMVLSAGIMLLQSGPDWDGIGATIGGFCSSVYSTFMGFISGILNTIGGFIGSLVAGAGNILSVVGSLFNGIFSGLGGFISGLAAKGQEIISGIGTTLSGIGSKIGEWLAPLGAKMTSLKDGMAKNFEGIKDKLGEIASEGIDNIVGGITDGLTRVTEAAKGLGSGVLAALKNVLGMESPSKETKEIGAYFDEGFANGVDENSDLVTQAASLLGQESLGELEGLPIDASMIGSEIPADFSASMLSSASDASAGGAAINASVLEGAGDIGPQLSAKATAGVDAYSNSLNAGVPKVRQAASRIGESTVSAFKTLPARLRNQGMQAGNSFAMGLSSQAGIAAGAASHLVSSAGSVGGSLYGHFHSIGRSASQGLADGINSGLGAAWRAANSLAEAAEKAAKAKLKVNSPSKVFIAIGGSVGEGFVMGIERGVSDITDATSDAAGAIPEAFSKTLSGFSVDISDILDTDYNPVITPVINPAEFNYGLQSLNNAVTSGLNNNLSFSNLNYTGEISAKMDDYNDLNQQMMETISKNVIDYNLLGAAVAGALINAGVHVEMDGGQLMGYLAGEIRDARRMFST